MAALLLSDLQPWLLGLAAHQLFALQPLWFGFGGQISSSEMVYITFGQKASPR